MYVAFCALVKSIDLLPNIHVCTKYVCIFISYSMDYVFCCKMDLSIHSILILFHLLILKIYAF